MSKSENILLSILELNIVPEQFYLAIVAGIWEELVFRVFTITLLVLFLTKIVGYNAIFSVFIAISMSALLFSIFHYIGPL